MIDIEPGSTLTLIDCQNGFLGPRTGDLRERLARFLTERGPEFDRILATRFLNTPASPYMRFIHWTRLQTPPETDLADGIRADIILDKHSYVNADDILAHSNPGHPIYLAGADTDVCVLQNAAGLFDKGIDVRVLYDLTYTNGGPDAYAAALPLLGRTIGRGQIIRGDR